MGASGAPSSVTRRSVLAGLGAAAAAVTTGGLGCARAVGRRAHPISLWFSYGGKNRKVLLELIEQFHREQSDVRVLPTFQGDYFEGLAKLRTALFAGRPPTVSHVVGEVVPYLARAGVLEPLDGVGADVVADLVPELSQAGTFVGGAEQPLVALPFNRSTPIAFYDRTLFRELGLSAPRTWTELREVARRATSRPRGATGRGDVRWGFECPVDWWFWVALVGQAGGDLVRPSDGAVTLGGEAGVRALRLWQTMVHHDRSMKPPPGRDYDAWQATNSDFLAGRAVMIWTSTAFVRYLEENASFEVGAAALPRDVRAAVPTGGTMFVVPRAPRSGLPTHDDRQAALRFLRWMASPGPANAWATRTGYMPVSKAGLRELERTGYYERHPNDRVALDQLAHARPWPWAPELFRVQREVVQPRLEQAVLLGEDAEPILDEARRRAEEQ